MTLALDFPADHCQIDMGKRTQSNRVAGDSRSAEATREARRHSVAGEHEREPGAQGPNTRYWQAVGSTRAAAKRAKRP